MTSSDEAGADRGYPWSAYATSEVHVDVAGRRLTASELAQRLRDTVYAITAWNPMSVPTDPDRNALANHALEVALVHAGATIWPAVGAAEDGTWSEEGFAVTGITQEEALRLGRRFAQLAIFRARDGELVVLECGGLFTRE
jgi:hypothetical protein